MRSDAGLVFLGMSVTKGHLEAEVSKSARYGPDNGRKQEQDVFCTLALIEDRRQLLDLFA